MAALIAASIGFVAGYTAHLVAAVLKNRKPEVVSSKPQLERQTERLTPAQAADLEAAHARFQLILDSAVAFAATEIARRRR